MILHVFKLDDITVITNTIGHNIELHISPSKHDEIKLLFKEMQRYIQDGERVELNIPFDAYNTTIEGVLATRVKERVWVKFAAKQ